MNKIATGNPKIDDSYRAIAKGELYWRIKCKQPKCKFTMWFKEDEYGNYSYFRTIYMSHCREHHTIQEGI